MFIPREKYERVKEWNRWIGCTRKNTPENLRKMPSSTLLFRSFENSSLRKRDVMIFSHLNNICCQHCICFNFELVVFVCYLLMNRKLKTEKLFLYFQI